jgi:hypothetical protein
MVKTLVQKKRYLVLKLQMFHKDMNGDTSSLTNLDEKFKNI